MDNIVLPPQKESFATVIRRDAAWMAPLILACAVLLFYGLGQYSLWDDEAMTALPALAIVETGDTSAMVGHNLVAYQNGKHLKNMKDRLAPPLAPYIAAPLLALFPTSEFAARFPFALAGLAAFAFLIIWMRAEGASLRLTLLAAAGWLCNVSLLLYSRQCRYYAVVILLMILCGYAYSRYLRGRGLIFLSVLLSLMYATFYVAYFVVGACLALDYFIYGRKQRKLDIRDLAAAILTQAILIIPVFLIWNPLGTVYSENAAVSTWSQRLALFFWNIRDINANEFCSIPLLLVIVVAAWRFGHVLLLRLGLFVFATIVITSAISPQPLAGATQADIRYLVGLIPIFIVMSALAIDWLAGRSDLIASAAAVVMFGTNLLQGAPAPAGVRSTPALFVTELLNPVPEPYTPASRWLKEHVRAGQSVWVLPEYMMYPLMFSAPQGVYAWQLSTPPREQFKGLPPVHFKGMNPPDYIVAFGPVVGELRQLMSGWKNSGLSYTLAAELPAFWKDLYRPELFWRTFKPVAGFDQKTQGIFIFKRTEPPVAEVTP